MKAKHIRIIEGDARNEAWRALSPQLQLSELDRRLGKGQGARRQRAKLADKGAR